MYLKQADLFWGMSQSVIQAITAKGVKAAFQPGDVIFRADQPAASFYVLIKGKVRMELQGSKRHVYSSDTVGEIFGWSSLIRGGAYLSTVRAEADTLALRFDCRTVTQILEQDADSAAIFYKRLASAVGNRLLRAYELLD